MKIPKIPKKVTAFIVGLATTAAPVVKDVVTEKLKQESAKMEREKIYLEQKHNGTVKTSSIIFSLIALVLTILAFKESKIILGIIGVLSVISYVITFLYCLEIINEKKHNTYKIIFIVGDMLMVSVATLLFF